MDKKTNKHRLTLMEGAEPHLQIRDMRLSSFDFAVTLAAVRHNFTDKQSFTVFLSHFGAFLELSLIFAKKYVHSQTIHTNSTTQWMSCKSLCTYSKSLVHLSKVIFMSMNISCHQNEKSLCHCSQTRQTKCLVMLSI